MKMGIFESKIKKKVKKRKKSLAELANKKCKGVKIKDLDNFEKIKIKNTEGKGKFKINFKNEHAFNVIFDIIDNYHYREVSFKRGMLIVYVGDYAFGKLQSTLRN
ncbi:MAG: hypothetical protein R6U26_02815 [Candidatus Undinarchaeales archaeon]